MNMDVLMQFLYSFGFPVVMCGAMAWYVKYITDRNHDDIIALNAQHKEEINNVTVALNNNTLAIQKLIDKLED